MVEAGGIEPPSERFQPKASTCLSPDLDLISTNSQKQDQVETSSYKSHPIYPEHANGTSSLNDVQSTSREHGCGRR